MLMKEAILYVEGMGVFRPGLIVQQFRNNTKHVKPNILTTSFGKTPQKHLYLTA